MRRLCSLLVAALLLLPAIAHATTPNETGWHEQLTTYGGTWLNDGATPIYRACRDWQDQFRPAWAYAQPWQRCDQPVPEDRLNVIFVNADGSDKTPQFWPRMQNVPMPQPFNTGNTTDGLAVVENLTGQGPDYCEFWQLKRQPSRPVGQQWTSQWGGCAMDAEFTHVDGLRVWPTNQAYFGASASGIALADCQITKYDIEHGAINHPICVSVKASVGHKAPCTRDDSNWWGGGIQYCAKMKLDPSINVDAIREGRRWCAPSKNRTDAEAAAAGWDPVHTDCPLPPVARMILKAAQRYFVMPTDQHGGNSGVNFSIESQWRPDTQNFTGTQRDGRGFIKSYMKAEGCDGLNNTGEPPNTTSGTPVTNAPGDWEADCGAGTGMAWNAFPTGLNQWHEIP